MFAFHARSSYPTKSYCTRSNRRILLVLVPVLVLEQAGRATYAETIPPAWPSFRTLAASRLTSSVDGGLNLTGKLGRVTAAAVDADDGNIDLFPRKRPLCTIEVQ